MIVPQLSVVIGNVDMALHHARQLTTRVRVVGAIAFAFVFPSMWIGETLALLNGQYGDPFEQVLITPFVAIIPGFIAGLPFVLFASIAWAIFDHFNLHFKINAALIGGLTGGCLAAMVLALSGDWQQMTPMLAYGVCVPGGILTGLGVWWIAYGRQDRLPRPTVTRSPLNL